MGRNTLKFDTKGLEDLLLKLDEVSTDVKQIVEDALLQAAETITDDTNDALDKSNLPSRGKFSKGKTKKSLIKTPVVKWVGQKASVDVGFDYGKDGAGGFLITGTPRMKPNQALKKIYKSKKYMNALKEDMKDIFQDGIDDVLGG